MKKEIIIKGLFHEYEINIPEGFLDERFYESKEIIKKAIIDYKPYAVCLMLSGGDDSITALQVCIMMNIKIDYIIHGITGTGLSAVLPFVKDVAEKSGIKILYADAGSSFEDYVLRKGFFGRGKSAHKFSYHILKAGPFRKVISENIRKGIKGRRILLINGVRVEESDNRADNYGENPFRIDGNNIWVNVIHWWNKNECLKLLESENVKRSPVSIHLGRSGECNCGTMQSEADRILASEFDPKWGQWMMELRKEVLKIHGWDIGQNPSKKQMKEIENEVKKVGEFMPMCIGCKSRNNRISNSLFED